MRIGIKDRRVIKAFVDGEPMEGDKLSTDGQRLDGLWLGGRGIASKTDGYTIHLHDLGSRAAQSIHRAVRGMAPPIQMADFEKTCFGKSRRRR